ncbi:Uncharacterised nucleotidyltransferase [Methylobacterium sp. 174MFSha1.1]|uniref:nucleotidyltransferase family protein n=1 Tax=Methylobacterium sp. 174MFSha1.1 TaxID=1502749 RepID=UPI0008F20027|nr:nucleotidyltransferase family protein [Methylobacterium sp. 174MFSha1.1]SFU46965.1 Uncharacterised nucleotidyltransferase [Methylobacterium sp. 174MFSha1.1]
MRHGSAELRWLIGLCRYDLGGTAPSLDGPVDADAVAALAEAHRVPVIAQRSWQALAARALAPPPPAALVARAERGRRRSFLAAAHLVRLARALEGEGVPFVALKGPALSMQLHGDATVRVVRDLDVIVPRPRLAAAMSAAASAGWTVPQGWQALMRITARHDVELQPTLTGQPLLELHESLGPRFVQFRLDPFAAAAQGRVTVAGAAIPTLTGPMLATYVAWHGARGLWYRLAWLLDAARLLPRGRDEACLLVETARECGAEVAVRAASRLAGLLFAREESPWPPAAPRVARRVEQVSAWGLERLSIGIDSPRARTRPGRYRWLWREIAQQDAVARAAMAALGEVARPMPDDVRRLGLGLPLPVHHLARPYFVATRLLHDLAGRCR